MMVRFLAVASLCYLALHFGFQAIQRHAMLPLQHALIGNAAPALLVFPIHGLRVMCAWLFGPWSIAIMTPTALAIFAMHVSAPNVDPISVNYLLMAVTYLLSAPLSFCLVRFCLARPDEQMALEWRVIMLTGLLSGLINVMVYGLLFPPSPEGQAMMLWLITKLVGYMTGVFAVLLLLLMVLRLTRRAVRYLS